VLKKTQLLMKTIATLRSLLLTGRLCAAPFLVCDAVPSNANQGLNVVSYLISGVSASPITVAAQINADGSQQLHYDVGGLPNGSYTVMAAAINGFGKQGPESSPFTFTVGLPGAPTGLRLSPT